MGLINGLQTTYCQDMKYVCFDVTNLASMQLFIVFFMYFTLLLEELSCMDFRFFFCTMIDLIPFSVHFLKYLQICLIKVKCLKEYKKITLCFSEKMGYEVLGTKRANGQK